MKRTITYRMRGGHLSLMAVSLLLAFLALVPGKAWAEGSESDDEVLLDPATGLEYTKAGAIVGVTQVENEKLVIPASINGTPITQVGDGENPIDGMVYFGLCWDLSFAENPAGFTIKRNAFANFDFSQCEVNIGSSVTTIEPDAFKQARTNAGISFEQENPQPYSAGKGYSAEMFGTDMNAILEVVAPSEQSVQKYQELFKGYACKRYYVKGSEETDNSLRDNGIQYALDPAMHTATIVSAAEGFHYDHLFLNSEVTKSDGTKYTLTAIAPGAFKGLWVSRDIDLASTVTSIGAKAFQYLKPEGKDFIVYIHYTGDDLSGYASDMFADLQAESVAVAVYAENGKALEKLLAADSKVSVFIQIKDDVFITDDDYAIEKGWYMGKNLYYTRKLTEEEQKGGYVTTCLPFEIYDNTDMFKEEFEALYLADTLVVRKEDGSYHVKLSNYMPGPDSDYPVGAMIASSVPMLLKIKPGITEIHLSGNGMIDPANLERWRQLTVKDESGNVLSDVKMSVAGTFDKKDASSLYTFDAKGNLDKVNTDVLSPFRLALAVTDQQGNPINGVKFATNLQPGGGATGISDVKEATQAAGRSAIYAIDGKQVRPAGSSMQGLAKGVYIQNGKKVVVK